MASTRVFSDITPDEVRSFCGRLQESLLRALEAGTPVRIEKNNEWDDIPGGDYAWAGCRYIIHVGKSALEVRETLP